MERLIRAILENKIPSGKTIPQHSREQLLKYVRSKHGVGEPEKKTIISFLLQEYMVSTVKSIVSIGIKTHRGLLTRFDKLCLECIIAFESDQIVPLYFRPQVSFFMETLHRVYTGSGSSYLVNVLEYQPFHELSKKPEILEEILRNYPSKSILRLTGAGAYLKNVILHEGSPARIERMVEYILMESSNLHSNLKGIGVLSLLNRRGDFKFSEKYLRSVIRDNTKSIILKELDYYCQSQLFDVDFGAALVVHWWKQVAYTENRDRRQDLIRKIDSVLCVKAMHDQRNTLSLEHYSGGVVDKVVFDDCFKQYMSRWRTKRVLMAKKMKDENNHHRSMEDIVTQMSVEHPRWFFTGVQDAYHVPDVRQEIFYLVSNFEGISKVTDPKDMVRVI